MAITLFLHNNLFTILTVFNLPTLATGNVLSLADKESMNINGTIHKHTVKYERT